jgi:hypothetical protein
MGGLLALWFAIIIFYVSELKGRRSKELDDGLQQKIVVSKVEKYKNMHCIRRGKLALQ